MLKPFNKGPKKPKSVGYNPFAQYTQPASAFPLSPGYRQALAEEQAGFSLPIDNTGYESAEDIADALGLGRPTGGGSRGGGAARPVNPDPLGWRAIQREQTRRTGYDPLFANLDTELAQEQKASADREAAIRQATADARARASGITQGLTQSAADMQQRIGSAYAAGGSELDRLIADYAARQQAVQGGAARTLGAFGVGPEELGLIGPSAADSLGVMRGGLAGLGAVSQASMAGLPTAYQALGGDVELALTQGEQARLAKEAADRTAIERDINRRRAELGLQLQGDIFGIQDAEYARQGAYQ